MQAVPDEVKKCVVFIQYVDKSGQQQVAGTGFFVGYPIIEPEYNVAYVVTARHVIAGIAINSADNRIYLRINALSGRSKLLPTHFSDWKYHPDDSAVDIAVLDWTPDQKTMDVKTIHNGIAINDDMIKQYEIGAGDEVFITGLFSEHSGKTKNQPIIRTGNIALMPDEKIQTSSHCGAIDAYLIEARSISGLSGSPVFVSIGNIRRLINPNPPIPMKQYLWLGVMHGHWDLEENNRSGGSVNMGIGIVVPAAKVIEILSGKDFETKRLEARRDLNIG